MPASPVSPTETHPDDRESLALPSDVRGRLDEIGAGTAITDMKDSLLALARDGLSSAAAMTALCCRHANKFYISLPQARPFAVAPGLRSFLKHAGWHLVTTLAHAIMIVGSILLFFFRMTWSIIFWPTVIFLTVWMILQALAIGYSTSYTAVLAFTCQHRIPYIMDGICKSYDLPVNPQGSPAKQLNLSFGNLLQDNRMNISFETPYFISRYQTMARGFRAALPDVMLAGVDSVWIEGRLNISINQCSNTTTLANKILTSITGLINMHVLDTPDVIDQLESRDFLSSPQSSTSVRRPLAKTIVQWNSYGLVYLPSTFQQNSIDDRDLECIEILKAHIREMQRRATKLIDLIVLLQDRLLALGYSAEEITRRMNEAQANDKRVTYYRHKKDTLLWLREKIIGPATWEAVEVSYRNRAYREWGPKFGFAAEYFGNTASDLSTIEFSCQELIEMLDAEARIIKRGGKPSTWAKQQAKALDRGVTDLERKMGAYKAQQREFLARVFKDNEA